MNISIVLLVFGCVIVLCEGNPNTFLDNDDDPLKNYPDFTQHPLYPCFRCVCHARSGCYNLPNCARYSINEAYWKKAGSPLVSPSDDPEDTRSFKSCQQNDRCILKTLIKYSMRFGERDCNCDGEFDCKDRAAIHLFSAKCEQPTFKQDFADRFNRCARATKYATMLSHEGDQSCTVVDN